jgi:hypothetical protein
MTARVIHRDKVGMLTKIGQGGQGVVYGAPNVKTKSAASMVYKEYKPQTRAEINFTALAVMPALVEESLSYAEAERLISCGAWPCALVEDNSTPTGFVMPAIPAEFFIDLTIVGKCWPGWWDRSSRQPRTLSPLARQNPAVPIADAAQHNAAADCHGLDVPNSDNPNRSGSTTPMTKALPA